MTQAQARFWEARARVCPRRAIPIEPVVAVDKLTAAFRAAAALPGAAIAPMPDNTVVRVQVSALTPDIDEHRCAGGFFVEYAAETLDSLIPVVKRKYQTLGYLGWSRRRFAASCAKTPVGRGPHRARGAHHGLRPYLGRLRPHPHAQPPHIRHLTKRGAFMAKPLLSFVIPCYRSAHTIGAVVRELNDTLAARADEYDHEIILVNDGSPDDTADAIRELCARDPAIVFVDLSRNFGQHSAVMAGFHQVRGDIVICLDDDGQTPACECFKLIDKVAEGYDIVFAQYPKRRQSALRNLGSRFNAACNHYFFGQPRELTVNSYYACRRFVWIPRSSIPTPFPT